jgi:asparagine synthase (glutamine-hydrolysing)
VKALQRVIACAGFNSSAKIPASQMLLGSCSTWTETLPRGELSQQSAAGLLSIILGNPCDEAFKPLTHDAVIARYRSHGADFAKGLTGTFAYVLFDENKNTLLAGVDRMARVPLAFTRVANGAVAVASSAADLARVPGVSLTLSPQALYDYVYFHMIPAPFTLYERVTRLAPGEQLLATEKELTVRAVWKPTFIEDKPATFEDAKAQFRHALELSVRDALAGTANPGTFLSGGTDSSTVTGLVAQVSGKPAKAFSIGFDEEGYDETGYAKIAAKKFPVDHTIYYVTPKDVVDALPKVVEAYDQPFGNASAIPTFYCALRAQEAGISHMIAGDGGDELFGGNDRYAEQAQLAKWGELPNALRAPVRGVAGALSFVPIVAKVRRKIGELETPLPARMQHYNLVNQLGAPNIFERDFLVQCNERAPIDLLNTIFHGTHAKTDLSKMLALDWRITLADSDLPKVQAMCAQAGMPVRYPMLDDRLTDFSLSLPNDFKLKGNQLRWFFKEALRDFLPEEIITKQKHGFGLPFGMWLTRDAQMQAQTMSALDDLKKRNIVRPAFIDELKSKIRGTDAGYYGVLVWVFVMLELWMQAHVDRARLA